MFFTKAITVCFLAFFFIKPNVSWGQDDLFGGFEKRKAKAVAALSNFPDQNTARVEALVAVINTAAFVKQQQSIMSYFEEAMSLSRKINYETGLAECYRFLGNFYKSSLHPAEAQLYFDSVLLVSRNTKDSLMLKVRAAAQRWKGLIFYEQENYNEALSYFFEALKHYEHGNDRTAISLYEKIARIYIRTNNLDLAAYYAGKCIVIGEKFSPVILRAPGYLTMIDICIQKKELHLGLYYLDKIKPCMPDSIELSLNFGYYESRGQICYLLQQYDSAYVYYQLAYTHAVRNDHKEEIGTALNFLSIISLKLGDQDMAKKYAMENMALAEEIDTKADKITALLNLSDYYHQTKENDKAYGFMQRATVLKDSLLSETNLKQVNRLAAIYEADKKQSEIFRLQNDKLAEAAAIKHKSVLNGVFVATIIVMLFFGYLAYKNFKDGQKIAYQKQEIQQQKINELEKDRQLLTVDAILRGQEEERSRIAKDLHDGLGGMLSGAKLSLVNMKEGLHLPAEESAIFEHSVFLLDKTICELRKVAHNLMPEILVRFGLDEALKEYCNSIQASAGISVVYQQFGKQRKLSRQAEINIYRIVQELVNNALKHACAKQILVQVTRHHGKTSVTVEDDGKGFDVKMTWKKKGAGFSNIKYRVDYFKGSLDIVSGSGNGTSVNMQLIA
ncbi:MAG: ATP-binding protein [Bacteroidota bacterium]